MELRSEQSDAVAKESCAFHEKVRAASYLWPGEDVVLAGGNAIELTVPGPGARGPGE